jgi:hypothetical protein
MALETNNLIVNQDAPEQTKKPYVTPQLIVYGNLEQITLGGGAETGDGDEGGTMGDVL